jgi:hypothetical protein
MENKLTSKQYIDAAVALAKFSLQAKSEVRWKDEWTDEIAALVQFQCAERNRIYGLPMWDVGAAEKEINPHFDPSLGGALSGRTFTVEQANAIIEYVKTAAHGYVEDRKCPHYEVRFRSQQNYNSQTGKPDYKPAGWYCAWCGQPFGLSPSLDPLYDAIDSEILESVLKKGKDRDDKNI